MSDIVAMQFEVGRSATGLSDMTSWINSTKTSNSAANVLAILPHKVNDQNFLLVIMSTSLQNQNTIAAQVVCGEFEIGTVSYQAMINWMNAQFTAGFTNLTNITQISRGAQKFVIVMMSGSLY
jgi:hypothetical protein